MFIETCPEYEINYGVISQADIDRIMKWALDNIKGADEETIREILSEI